MKRSRIPDTDGLFRHWVHPTQFKGKNGSRFAPEKIVRLYDEDAHTLLASLAWQRYLPTTRHVHSYGCRLASGGRIYCGAYGLYAGSVRDLVTTVGLDSADVIHHPENDEIAHTDLRISLRIGDTDEEGTKTAILDRLWQACSGPLRFICEDDRDVNPHPSTLLTVAPQGEYSDTRSLGYRVFGLFQFWIHCLLWRSLHRQWTDQ
jgi:hypothetical protein